MISFLSCADFSWIWNEKKKSDDVIICSGGTEAYFHPDYSCGTAAVRGSHMLLSGWEHYWEVKMASAVYGTDMVYIIFLLNFKVCKSVECVMTRQFKHLVLYEVGRHGMLKGFVSQSKKEHCFAGIVFLFQMVEQCLLVYF